MLALLLMIAADDVDTLIATARSRTVAEAGCERSLSTTDISVCGLRRADRFRVPFAVHDAGDPRYEAVADERHRLLHKTTPLDDLRPFQVGGGMAGVSVSTSGSGGSVAVRKPAP